jgi:transcriptional regulator with XRE-family HTH domain
MSNTFGKFLKLKREDLGLSLREFAEICDISHSYLNKLEKELPENGKLISPTIETLVKISCGLNISLQSLIDLTGVDKIEQPYLSKKDLNILLDIKSLSEQDQKIVLALIERFKDEQKINN